MTAAGTFEVGANGLADAANGQPIDWNELYLTRDECDLGSAGPNAEPINYWIEDMHIITASGIVSWK
jgi:hypothetical protein